MLETCLFSEELAFAVKSDIIFNTIPNTLRQIHVDLQKKCLYQVSVLYNLEKLTSVCSGSNAAAIMNELPHMN